MGFKVDFSDVESGFEPIPAGHYLVRVTEGELRHAGENAKHPGSEMILWTLQVIQGEYEGRKLFYNTTLLSHALFGLKGLLAATGIWTKEELDSTEFDFEIEDVVGSEIIVVVSVGKYQGEDTNNVKRCRPATEENLEALSGDSSLLP